MRRAPFRKDCDEYTTKRLMRQIWYDQKGMVGMIIAVSSEAEECENVNVPETEEYLTA